MALDVIETGGDEGPSFEGRKDADDKELDESLELDDIDEGEATTELDEEHREVTPIRRIERVETLLVDRNTNPAIVN